MEPEASLSNLVHDEFCALPLSKDDEEIWKRISEDKKLWNLKNTGIYRAREITKGGMLRLLL